MKIKCISVWDSHLHLARQMQLGLDESALIVVKNLNMDMVEYTALLDLFGDASAKQMKDNPHGKIMVMGDAAYETSGKWFDKRDELRLHFDGVLSLPLENSPRFMPLTFMYGAEVGEVIGGETYFYDVHDLYAYAMHDDMFKDQVLGEMRGIYQNRDSNPISPAYVQDVLRFSPYTCKPYLMIDEWYTHDLKTITRKRPATGLELLSRYKQGFTHVYRYQHQWEPNDLVVWSNEAFIHGRTPFENDGRRVIWRGIVWNNVRLRSKLLDRRNIQ
jgi:alpha-ketoglutarate-dependent taurine dioxygenase